MDLKILTRETGSLWSLSLCPGCLRQETSIKSNYRLGEEQRRGKNGRMAVLHTKEKGASLPRVIRKEGKGYKAKS